MSDRCWKCGHHEDAAIHQVSSPVRMIRARAHVFIPPNAVHLLSTGVLFRITPRQVLDRLRVVVFAEEQVDVPMTLEVFARMGKTLVAIAQDELRSMRGSR